MTDTVKLQKLLQTLSDVNRLKIIHCIGNTPTPVGEIVKTTGLSQPLVSHHLKALRKNGIVDSSRKGPFVYYRLSTPEWLEVLGILSKLALNVDDSAPLTSMFPCPPWWMRMHGIPKMKKGDLP